MTRETLARTNSNVNISKLMKRLGRASSNSAHDSLSKTVTNTPTTAHEEHQVPCCVTKLVNKSPLEITLPVAAEREARYAWSLQAVIHTEISGVKSIP